MCLFQPQRSVTHCTLLKGTVVWCIVLHPRHTYGSLESNPCACSRVVVFLFFNPIKLASLALPLPLTPQILLDLLHL